jgi:peptide/nickel transport system substrate-binding protein
MRGSRSLFAGLTIAVAVAVAGPAAAENVLRFTGMDSGTAIMDPHSSAWPERKVATKQVYEALLDVDSNLAIVPQLAVAWNVAGLTHWDFELRRDARFHDGSPFTAEDVVFSIERARAETSDFRGYVEGIAAVEVVDDHTVRITTIEPDPSLWLKLAEIAIMSTAWAQEHGVVEPADYQKAHEETYASRHANGTGPFMVEAFELGGDYVLVRNSDWWGAAEYPHNIDRIVQTRKEANAEKLAALLEGEIDLLQTPPYSALDQIRGTPGLKLTHRPKLLTQWLGLDQGSTELRSSNVKGNNPFKDKRVRQAMAHAIDIEPILRPLMHEMYRARRDGGGPGRQRLCTGVGPAGPLRPRQGQSLACRCRLPGWLQRDPRLPERLGRRRDRHLRRGG